MENHLQKTKETTSVQDQEKDTSVSEQDQAKQTTKSHAGTGSKNTSSTRVSRSNVKESQPKQPAAPIVAQPQSEQITDTKSAQDIPKATPPSEVSSQTQAPEPVAVKQNVVREQSENQQRKPEYRQHRGN